LAPGISFGHFNIVGGAVREDGPYVGVIEDRNPAETLADLYLVIEPARPGSEAFCPELLSLISGQFGRPQYSLTGNLLQSLRAAQEHLRAWNKTAPPERQAAVGASCLAVSGDEAYLAQIGPGLAYFRHDGHLRRMEPIEPEAQAALGTTIACAPCFSRFELSQGDTLLLVTSRFQELLDDETADLILSLPPGEALPEIYKIARNQTDFSALYLAVTGELRPPAMEDGRGAGRSARDGSRPAGQMQTRTTSLAPQQMDVAGFSAFAPDISLTGAGYPQRRTSIGELPHKVKRRELERLTDRHSLTLPRPALYTVAAVFALTLAGWFGLPHLLRAGREDRYTTLVHDAEKQQQIAGATQDLTQKRALIEKIQADIIEARTLRGQTPELVTLQASASTAIQSLDQVRPLPSVATVADLGTTPVAARSASELAVGSQLYVLDNSNGTVFGFNPGGKTTPSMAVFEPGKLVESISTGRAMHIAAAAAPAGGSSLLYILDSNRRLFSLDDGGTLRSVGLAGSSDWKSAAAIAVGGQDLYVLDSLANQIWHYAYIDGNFTDPPKPTLTKADLHDAAQLSIAGDTYVSTVNGKLLRFADGHLAELKLSGIDHALLAPQPPILDQTSGMELIADPGNQRVVVADPSGGYRYQYSGAALQGLRSIALEPSSGVLYALCEQKLIAAPLR
jgi:hypothetical protein